MSHLEDGVDLKALVALSNVPSMIPPLRGDKAISLATVYRWSARGLKTVVVGGTRATTEAWLRDFIDSRTAARAKHRDGARSITKGSGRRRHEQAETELDRLGV